MRKSIPALAIALSIAAPASGALAQEKAAAGYAECLHYKGHVFEVCTAYVGNSAYLSLVPYYRYVHSPNQARAVLFSYRLTSRYRGSALKAIHSRTDNWPTGENSVSPPRIKVISVTSNLVTNTAKLVTQESWSVKSPSGKPLYTEKGKRHTIIMNRIQGLALHKWVVSSIS